MKQMKPFDEKNKLIESSKLEFSKKCRRISIKNIPLGVLNQDILELLKPYFYQQIHIDKNSQSCKAVLLDGNSAARCIEELNNRVYRGQRLTASLASCDFMLCVTQLPITYTDEQFLSLITPFGTPERCFLVHSEKSGLSKGYGCVEFTSKESSIKAKNQLNGYKIENNTLQVHWLDSIPSTYTGLYSCCLLVENLPPRFKDTRLLFDLFSRYNPPKFCQLADCETSDFAIVEYSDPVVAEDSWNALNNYHNGTSLMKVSFCVPGPCGLVVLNALKASRDMKRANPTGGLLPTPTHINIDHTLHSSLMHQKHDIMGSMQLNQGESLLNTVSQDPEVQNLLNQLHSRLSEAGVPIGGNRPMTSLINNQSYHPMSAEANALWLQHQVPMNNNPVLNQLQNGRPLDLQYRSDYSNHRMVLRSRSGSFSSSDSGAKVEDEVFEPSARRRISQEENYKNGCHDEPVNGTFHLQQKVESRTHSMGDSRTLMQTSFHPNSNIGPHNPLLFLRDDSQRSESADSAYSGSQGSNSSDYSFSSSERHPTTQSNLIMTSQANQLMTSHSMAVGDHRCQNGADLQGNHPNFHGPPGVQRYPPPISSHESKQGLLGAYTGQPKGSASQNGSHGYEMSRSNSLPRGSSSAFTNIISHNQLTAKQNGIPKPEFTKNCAKVPVSICMMKNGNHKLINSFSSLSDSEATLKLNGHITPKLNRSQLSTVTSNQLGADSPTQLQLLGNNLVEGLMGDSPRSASGAITPSCPINTGTTGRLLRALNLFSPTDFAASPQTPTSNFYRHGFGHVLPSPEPSPEAGAYVGQHSQGIGGHYADSCFGLAGDIFAHINAAQISASPVIHKRRRSNET